MKLFAALLAASTIAVVAPATAQASCGSGGGPASNGCSVSGTYTDNSGDDRGNQYDTTVDSNGVNGDQNDVASIDGNRNRINTGTINRGTLAGAADGTVRGGEGGEGGEGGRAVIREGAVDNDNKNVLRDSGNSENTNRNVLRDSGNSRSNSRSAARGGDQSQTSNSSATGGSSDQSQSSSNTNTSQSNNSNRTSSRSSANNNGNSQTLNYTNIDIPEATVAPLTPNGVPGQVGDVIVPLPSITGGAFATRDNDIFSQDRTTTGVSVGFQIPLGTGQVNRAVDQIIARRDSAARFQLIQEATWMLQQGVLDADAHPEHWAALYGAPPVASVF